MVTHNNSNVDSMNVSCSSAFGSNLGQDDQDEKPNLLVEFPEMQDPALQSLSGNDSDDSEMVEHDVKVCDICGDAGEEEFLAICSKCSDGAEHIYCMREMLRKLPQGDWLCEECKLAEDTEKPKQGSDAEIRNKARQSSFKRHSEIVEMAPACKKQADETSFGSLKSSCLMKSPSLSRDSSFKGLDKGKVKQAHQASLGFHSKENACSSTTCSRLQPSKIRSVEEKPNQVTPKDEPSSCLSWTAERRSSNLDENLQDGSSWSQESSCQSVKFGESSDNHSKPAKESGHTADLCAAKEEMNLKAAIEAAILKKPGIFRKKKESNQSDGISGMASSDNSSSNKTRNFVSDEAVDNRQTELGICSLENSKQTGLKSFHALAPVPIISKTLTIPEHEYIWQGAFELRRGGNVFDLYCGVQAHLSTYASPKVLDVVNKFPNKISLDEVPRASTWPKQFHDDGPKEYNIALYFFAKDLESYEKGYKNLLDNMIKRDLALKGSFDGVDFLIFTSTQLPENSKRWNMLFFLWGVFRGRRSGCLDSVSSGRWQLNNRKRPLVYLEESDGSFFPVPRKLNSSNNEDRSQGVPNLELALGAETNPQ